MTKNTSLKPRSQGKVEVSILLHDIRSVHNVGSIFRTADAFGVSKIYISGYTPSPKDRFGRMRSDITKVALGAEETVPWEQISGVGDFLKSFKKTGEMIVAVEQDPRSIQLTDIGLYVKDNSNILIILGNEVGGVEKELLDMADIIAEIPMRGKKESLNVSVTAGIALFAFTSF